MIIFFKLLLLLFIITINRLGVIIKTSVRVFFEQRNGTKNVSRTVFNDNSSCSRYDFLSKITRTDEKLSSKTNYTQRVTIVYYIIPDIDIVIDIAFEIIPVDFC